MFFKSFQQFLDEAKKAKKPKPLRSELRSEKQVMKMLNRQGGIGGKAIEKHLENNPPSEPRTYKLD